MAERCVKGDYIGFTFGDVHSSELGLMRVSNGSRYEQDLLPPLQDKTVQVNGRDGAVYFNSTYNTRPIKVPVAFDNMTEESFQKLKELLMDKKPKYLWFDETPYKQWLVKSANAQNFKWVCFDESKNIERIDDGDSEGTKKRIYKGEGTLEFSCFTPYAESRVKFSDEEIDHIWVWNKKESPRRLIKIEDQSKVGSPFYYQTVSKTDQPNTANKNFKQSFSLKGDTVKNTFHCISYKNLRDSSTAGSSYIYFNQNRLLKTEVYCFYFSDRYFFNHEEHQYKAHNANWYNFHTRKKVDEIGEFPITIEDFLEQVENDTSKSHTLYLIMTLNGNIYPIIQKPETIDENIGIITTYSQDYYYDKNYPVTLEFRRHPSVDWNYNFNEWIKTSQMSIQEETLIEEDFNVNNDSNMIFLYNAGIKETPLNIFYINNETQYFPGAEIYLCRMDTSWWIEYFDEGYIKIQPFNLAQGDVGFVIDSKLKMLKGIDEKGTATGNIYTKYIEKGDFFKLPPSIPYSDVLNDIEGTAFIYLLSNRSEGELTGTMSPEFTKVEYKYQYI